MVRSVSSARVSAARRRRRPERSRRNAPIAPGTVGMHSATSNMRRSRLKPITYSRCCQRPSSPLRLATLVLPLTAPTSGSGERLDETADRVGFEDGVAVDEDEQVAAACADAGVERRRLAGVGLPDHRGLAAGRSRRDDVGGAVGRAVVDDDDLDLGVVAGDQRSSRSRRCWPPRCRPARSTETGPR